MEKYDVIIVGAGFAGISAASFAGAWGLKTLVLDDEKPPQLWSYPGRSFLWTMSGAELIQKIVKETKRRGVEIHVGERVMDLEINGGGENCENFGKRIFLRSINRSHGPKM
ncbi:MAG: FAD-binding protein [Candidatus Bathyarchaeia archaeon]